MTTLRMLPSPLRDRVGHLTTDRFRGYSFHLRCGLLPPCLRFEAVVPAHLRVGGPRVPQNSVPGCWLGFTRATITGRLVLCASRRTAHRTVREPLDSHGSYHPVTPRPADTTRLLPFGWPHRVARWFVPFAPPELPGFNTTTRRSAPAPRIGTCILVGPLLGLFP